ncbi:MAG: hypothetical protein ABI180_12795 [Microcoleus sp.]
MHNRSPASHDLTLAMFSDRGDRSQKNFAFDTRAGQRRVAVDWTGVLD